MKRLLLFAFSISGAAALIYEVAWTRALSLLMGSTTYAVSTMLATFMAGLALGGFIGGKIADRYSNPYALFGFLEFGIGVFGLITVPLINSLPPLYFVILDSFALSPKLYFLFQFILCAMVMIVPTTLMGATFPVVSKALTPSMDSLGKWVGNAYSSNTFGAILGSVAAGFLLIPLVGVKATTFIAAGGNVIVAAVMIASSGAAGRRNLVIILLCMLMVPGAVALASREPEWPVTFYMSKRYESYDSYVGTHDLDRVLMDREFREGRVKLWIASTGLLHLNVGGKHEGTSSKDISNTLLASYLPIASHRGPESMLTIGLGTGFTLGAAKQHVRDVALAEINDGVIEGLRRFGPEGLLDGVEVNATDGRNYVLTTPRKFDIITSTPSYPSERSVGGLFTKEYYEIASGKLNPGGIYCQWLPYYALSNDDVTIMLKTFSSVFPHVYLWKVEHTLDLIMVGSREPFEPGPEEVRERTETLNLTPYPIPVTLSRTPQQVSDIVAGAADMPVNTDDHPIIEFHVARNILSGVKD